jgi:L-lactate dehydrogenase (cytochrome)
MPDMFDGTVCWDDLRWIRGMRDGPIVLKGVTTVGQAEQAVHHGLDAVIVSNHGGRQLDHLPATIDVLPRIVDAADDRLEVLVDSGFRRGSDTPRRSPWAPKPSCSAGRTCTGWPRPARPESGTASTSWPANCG